MLYDRFGSDFWPRLLNQFGHRPLLPANQQIPDIPFDLTQPFDSLDVDEEIATAEGMQGGPAWIGVFKLVDSRYAILTAGFDSVGSMPIWWGTTMVWHELDPLLDQLKIDDLERLGLT